MGTGLDDAIERMAQVVPVIVRSELKSVPLLFELSFGPACWLATKTDFAQLKTIAAVYEPLIRIALHKKGLYGRSLRSYATALSAGDQGVHVLLLMAAALIPDEVLPVDTR